MKVHSILTHPGSAHKDEFLACAVLVAVYRCPIFRREPELADLEDPYQAVVDVGGRHEPELLNFDHHQFSIDAPPYCALSLVLMHLDLYDDAKEFCDWLEAAERFDTTGPKATADWLGVDRDVLARLMSPIDISLLRRFARAKEIKPKQPLYTVLSWIGKDLLHYLKSLRKRIQYLEKHGQFWDCNGLSVFFVPRTKVMNDDPSAGIVRYLKSIGKEDEIAGLVYPDRRGTGYGLSRNNDDQRLDFTRLGGESDVHFVHNRGFIAKTTVTDQDRLRELLLTAKV